MKVAPGQETVILCASSVTVAHDLEVVLPYNGSRDEHIIKLFKLEPCI